jgi:hypothetical protein
VVRSDGDEQMIFIVPYVKRETFFSFLVFTQHFSALPRRCLSSRFALWAVTLEHRPVKSDCAFVWESFHNESLTWVGSRFINRPDIDFGNVDSIEPAQEFDVVEDRKGVLEYQVKLAKFRNLHCLALHISANCGADISVGSL